MPIMLKGQPAGQRVENSTLNVSFKINQDQNITATQNMPIHTESRNEDPQTRLYSKTFENGQFVLITNNFSPKTRETSTAAVDPQHLKVKVAD